MTSEKVVVVGVGEYVDRPDPLDAALDPVGLAAEAARRAAADAGATSDILSRCDSIDLMHLVSWRYEDTVSHLTARLGISPRRAVYREGGGEMPVRAVHEAALRIASGASRVAIVCGGEAGHASRKARTQGVVLPWPARAAMMENPWQLGTRLNPLAFAHGIDQPTLIYPLYENACTAAWGITPERAHAESAAMWSDLSQVAADNPHAWSRRSMAAEAIAETGLANRPIAYPYNKLMVANPMVNMGSAVLLMSESEALAAGISPERLVYLLGGAAADEPDDYLARDRFDRAAAQEAVLSAASEQAPGGAFDAVELYSCFPCVPKMARRTLDLAPDARISETGGLTFFGGPMSNYMGHATCAMVRRLRGGGTGLLYGQGGFVTKHHALVLSSTPVSLQTDSFDRNGMAAASRGSPPRVRDDLTGPAVLETHTVVFHRDARPERAVVVARGADGSRTMARVPVDDGAALATLMSPAHSPVGRAGHLARADDGLLEWSFQ